MHRKLRVGILANSERVPAWAYRMLERIQESDYADIQLVIVKGGQDHKRRGFFRRLWQFRKRLVFVFLMSIDERFFQPRLDAFQPKHMGELLSGVPRITVTPRMTEFSDFIEGEDLEAVRAHEIDVLIRLGFRILRGGILEAARYGVWSYHQGDNRIHRGGPPGFWEVMEQWPVTGSSLQILGEDLDGGLVLARTFQTTDPSSVRRNQHRLYWRSFSLLPQKLKRLHAMGGDAFMAQVRRQNERPGFYCRPLYSSPDNVVAARLAVSHFFRALRRGLRLLLYKEQSVLFFDLKKEGRAPSYSFWRFKPIVPPADRLWADPHVLERDGRYFVFLEELRHRTMVGHISVMEIDRRGNCTDPVPIIQERHHLSYPFVFEYEGGVFMIPESVEARRIQVYRCTDFPRVWEPAMTLMEDVRAVDTTLLHRDGRWWLFTSLQGEEGTSNNDELYLFSGETPFTTNWTPHPLNPVVSDVRSGRPAGCLFEHEGRLYRPTQCGDGLTARSIMLNEVLYLGLDDFREAPAMNLEPDWDKRLRELHTLNFAGGITIIDARRDRLRLTKTSSVG